MTNNNKLIHIRGVLFRYTIRGGHASLAIIVTHDDSVSSDQQANVDERMVLVVVRLGGPEWNTTQLDDNTKPIYNRKVEKDNHDRMTLRSNIKRLCKLGNELEFFGLYAEQCESIDDTNEAPNSNASTDWHNWTRFIVDYYLPSTTTTNSSENESSNVRIYQALRWNPIQCQQTRSRYFESPPKKQQQKKKKTTDDT